MMYAPIVLFLLYLMLAKFGVKGLVTIVVFVVIGTSIGFVANDGSFVAARIGAAISFFLAILVIFIQMLVNVASKLSN